MKIIMGCDHGGFELKETLKKVLIEKGYEVEDYGIHKQERVDYPDYAQKVGEAIASGKGDQGILICGTGIGMSIAANKVKGVRAALCNDCYSAAKARQHNNANVLCMGPAFWGRALPRKSWKPISMLPSLAAIMKAVWKRSWPLKNKRGLECETGRIGTGTGRIH